MLTVIVLNTMMLSVVIANATVSREYNGTTVEADQKEGIRRNKSTHKAFGVIRCQRNVRNLLQLIRNHVRIY